MHAPRNEAPDAACSGAFRFINRKAGYAIEEQDFGGFLAVGPAQPIFHPMRPLGPGCGRSWHPSWHRVRPEQLQFSGRTPFSARIAPLFFSFRAMASKSEDIRLFRACGSARFTHAGSAVRAKQPIEPAQSVTMPPLVTGAAERPQVFSAACSRSRRSDDRDSRLGRPAPAACPACRIHLASANSACQGIRTGRSGHILPEAKTVCGHDFI